MTALGIYNPNSHYNRSLRAPHIPHLPVARDGEIWILEMMIRALIDLRLSHYKNGDLYGARLHAVCLGRKRAELRTLKAGAR